MKNFLGIHILLIGFHFQGNSFCLGNFYQLSSFKLTNVIIFITLSILNNSNFKRLLRKVTDEIFWLLQKLTKKFGNVLGNQYFVFKNRVVQD